MIKLPQLKLVQIFVEHLVSIYGDLKQAQSDDSHEGSKVSRKEIWLLLANFICDLGKDLESAFLARNSLDQSTGLRWKMIRILLIELSNLPSELEQAKSSESAGGKRITRLEAVEIIRDIVTNAAPKIIDTAKNDIS